jgi:hypothetical protein
MFLNRIVPIGIAIASSFLLVSSANAQGPVVAITSVSQTPTASNPTSRDLSVTATVSAGPSSQYIGFFLSRDDTPGWYQTSGSGPSASGVYNKIFANLSGGQYTLTVFGNNGVPNGQNGVTIGVTVPVSSGAPVVSIAEPTITAIAGSGNKNVSVTASALPGPGGPAVQYVGFYLTRTDAGVTTLIDSSGFGGNSTGLYTKTYNLSAGRYKLVVFANDGSGVPAAQSDAVRFIDVL